MIELKHDSDENTLRSNGRKFNESRSVTCQLGVIKNSGIAGSAVFQIGNTKVAAFLNGPHQVSVLIFRWLLFRSLNEEGNKIKHSVNKKEY